MDNVFLMNKKKIREAALDFWAALVLWRDKWWDAPSFMALNKIWTDEEKIKGTEYHSRLINPILETLDPIFELCASGDINELFDLIGYTTSQIGRTLGNELSFPEITGSYHIFAGSLQGGIEDIQFLRSKYCTQRLMPKN